MKSCTPTLQCERCTEFCPQDEYKRAPCNLTDDLSCQRCNTLCPSGMYLKRRCSGSETQDVSACASCFEVTCDDLPDHFNNLSKCEGNASLRLGKQHLCTPCQRCAPGFYETEPCRSYSNRYVPATLMLFCLASSLTEHCAGNASPVQYAKPTTRLATENTRSPPAMPRMTQSVGTARSVPKISGRARYFLLCFVFHFAFFFWLFALGKTNLHGQCRNAMA